MRGNSNNKALIILIILLAINLFVGGCRKRVVEMPQDPKEVRFSIASSSTSAQNAASRAKTDENNDFTTESQIGIYATQADQSEVHLALPENTNIGYGNPTGSTQWAVIAPAAPIKFMSEEQPMNFFAYHPYTAQAGTSVTLDPDLTSSLLYYTLPLDQSTLSALTAADLMWGKKFGVSESQGAVNLQFEHKLTKLLFKISLGEGWGDEQVTVSRFEVVGALVPSTAKLNLSTGALVAGFEVNTAVYANFSPGLIIDLRNEQQCQFIVIPTSNTNVELRFTVKGSASEEKVFNSILPAVELKAGHQRQMTVSIHKTTSLVVELSADIKPWDIISDISMEAI